MCRAGRVQGNRMTQKWTAVFSRFFLDFIHSTSLQVLCSEFKQYLTKSSIENGLVLWKIYKIKKVVDYWSDKTNYFCFMYSSCGSIKGFSTMIATRRCDISKCISSKRRNTDSTGLGAPTGHGPHHRCGQAQQLPLLRGAPGTGHLRRLGPVERMGNRWPQGRNWEECVHEHTGYTF